MSVNQERYLEVWAGTEFERLLKNQAPVTAPAGEDQELSAISNQTPSARSMSIIETVGQRKSVLDRENVEQ